MKNKLINDTTVNNSVYNKTKFNIMSLNNDYDYYYELYVHYLKNRYYKIEIMDSYKSRCRSKYPSWKLISKNKKQHMKHRKNVKYVERHQTMFFDGKWNEYYYVDVVF